MIGTVLIGYLIIVALSKNIYLNWELLIKLLLISFIVDVIRLVIELIRKIINKMLE